MQSVTPQNRHAVNVAEKFLSVHWDRKEPLLLGYSGGPDSKALLYSLLECGVTPHLAHVDHGWRKESKEEALELAEEAKALGCPFHTIRLEAAFSEIEARKKRFAFFSSLGCQKILLAHHGDDLAETVLKRILEGSHLSHLGGMQEVSCQGTLEIWRPFLKIKKEQILAYLESKGLNAFVDPTNFDGSNLRSRMRAGLMDYLEEILGKKIQDNFFVLSERAYELKHYLDEKTKKVAVEHTSQGIRICLLGLEPLEARHVLRKYHPFSRVALDTVIDWTRRGISGKISPKIKVDKGWIEIIQTATNENVVGKG